MLKVTKELLLKKKKLTHVDVRSYPDQKEEVAGY